MKWLMLLILVSVLSLSTPRVEAGARLIWSGNSQARWGWRNPTRSTIKRSARNYRAPSNNWNTYKRSSDYRSYQSWFRNYTRKR